MTRNTLETSRKDMSPAPKTERRTSGQSETQRFASMENFALFTLRGIQTHITCARISELLNPVVVTSICHMCEEEINRIKTAQELRKESKR
jgi:hypothetical protein